MCCIEVFRRRCLKQHKGHCMGGSEHTRLMTGLCSRLEVDMPLREAKPSHEASVAANSVQLVELSCMGHGNELDTLCIEHEHI